MFAGVTLWTDTVLSYDGCYSTDHLSFGMTLNRPRTLLALRYISASNWAPYETPYLQ